MNTPHFIWSNDSLDTILYIQRPENIHPCSFEIYLFNTAKHQNTQSTQKLHSFYLLRRPDHEAIALISFCEETEKIFVSPARAPFGGLQCHPDCNTQELSFFLSCVEQWMQKTSNAWVIKSAPFCYNPAINLLLHTIYLKEGYQPTINISHHIEITNRDFYLGIKKSERRRLNKCKQAGFTISLNKTFSPQVIFRFIEESYLGKKYKLSITEHQFTRLATTFPEDFFVFTVAHGHQLIAVGITIRVCKNTLYFFIPADLDTYRNFSPIVMLYEGIYEYCQKTGIQLLDLGISTDHHGIIKPGLVSFKENMGGVQSTKLSYRKTIG